MESSRFDALARAFAAGTSRRRTLGALAALAAAPFAADAKSKPNAPQPAACLANGKRCSQKASAGAGHGKGKRGKGTHHPPSCSKCCSRYGAAGPDGKPRCTCKSEGIACDGDAQCCSGQCRNETCTSCPPNTVFCPDGCANLQTDKNHCGSCENACDAAQRCQDGMCVCDAASCPRGCCDKNGACQRGTSDQACGIGGADCQACGTCMTCDGTTCAATDGACCDGGNGVCHGDQCAACAAGQRCQGGKCVCDATSCPNGCCNGSTCVPFADQTDAQCGTGGAACAACEECTTCGDGICANEANGADCGGADSGLHCCNGQCPPPPTCLPAGTCCDDLDMCHGCCSSTIKCPGSGCGGRCGCGSNPISRPCGDDRDCAGGAICVCGACAARP